MSIRKTSNALGGMMLVFIVGFVLIQLVFSQSAVSQALAPTSPVALVKGANVTRADAIRSFLREALAPLMKELDVPGVVVVIVDSGKAVVTEGFGVADREAQTPVDPHKTIFRIASVGKVFTALAALQLAAEGKLDLRADIDRYLDFTISKDAWAPVTLHDLLIHTAGFDERLIGYASRAVSDYSELGPYLSERMPARTRPPGEISSYSNHGFALAGYCVERASKLPFREYVHHSIFQPLGMSRTSYIVPPLPNTTNELAAEYWASGERAELTFSRPYPAGGVGTTGGDMARFIRRPVCF